MANNSMFGNTPTNPLSGISTPPNPFAGIGSSPQLNISNQTPQPISANQFMTPATRQAQPVNVVVNTAPAPKTAPTAQPLATQPFANPNASMQGVTGGSEGTPVQNTGFNVPIQTGPIESTQLNSQKTYNDLMNSAFMKRQQYEDQYLKAYNDYAAAKTAEQQGQLQTLAGDQYAKYYSGASNIENALGLAGLTASQNAIQNASRNIATQGALLQSQGIGNLLGYNQQDIGNLFTAQQNVRSNAPEFSNFTFNESTGEVYGTVRDPRTGETVIKSFGNQYKGTFNQNNPQVGGGNGGYDTGIYGSQGYGNINMLPEQMKKFVVGKDIGGSNLKYIDGTKTPVKQYEYTKQAAAAAGIPFLDEGGVKAVDAAQQILLIADAAKALSIRNLSSGIGGRVSDSLKNWANNFLQFNPDLGNFQQLRDAAAKATTALGGGAGSGLRMSSGLIDSAINNMPLGSDNLESALSKADALATQIINGLYPVFPDVATGKYGNLLQSQYNSGGSKATDNSIINTKVGPVDNSWFN